MKLQTKIPLKSATNRIDHDSRLLLLGSCFAQHIGEKFDYYKFQMVQNPFGILFHPLAIEKLIVKAVNGEKYSEKDIFFHNERWHCFDAHSVRSTKSKEILLDRLNTGLTDLEKKIVGATHIIITMGTSWVYRHVESGQIVANCHKVPQDEFEKELLSIGRISNSLKNIFDQISLINKHKQLIFTISPIRHLRDGFTENQLSKSRLIAALFDTIGMPSSGDKGFYFPSYELMIDELRDYRFYDRDMIHPNELAIDYIWQRFCEVWISPEALPTMKKIDEVQKGLMHRPFDADSKQHREFVKSLNSKIMYLQQKHPFMTFEDCG